MPRFSRRNTLLLCLVLAAGAGALGLGFVHAAQAEPPGQAGQAASPSGRAAGSTADPAAGADLSRVWWNRPQYVKLLGLTDTQRAAMDKLVLERLEARRAQAREYTELRTKLGDQLAAGKWKEAEATAAALGEPAGAMARGEGQLTVAVVRLLDSDQRQRLAATYPAVFHRPWLRGGITRRGPVAGAEKQP